MKKALIAAVAGVAVAFTVACAGGSSEEAEIPEKRIPCYHQDGRFAEWDDDCKDDGLLESPPPSSRGMQTSGPLKPPSKAASKAPAPKSTRR